MSFLLSPVGALYGSLAGRRMQRAGVRAPVPVICVGNFTVGGAGKTPTALAIAGVLRAMGETPAFLSRGYGGRLKGPVRVEEPHSAADVGDEPLLLARSAPTIISRDRPAGARLAARSGASVIIMDDGLQNPSLAKDIALAVVDGTTGIGNGLCLPAGPLRAPMEAQWSRADAVVVIGEGRPGADVAEKAEERGKTVFRGSLAPDASTASRLKGERLLAFAGIGRPEKFFDTLRACGGILVETRSFPDHHVYSPQEIACLLAEAREQGLRLVTTEKDLMRLSAPAQDLMAQDLAAHPIMALPVHLRWDDPEGMKRLLKAALERGRSARPR